MQKVCTCICNEILNIEKGLLNIFIDSDQRFILSDQAVHSLFHFETKWKSDLETNNNYLLYKNLLWQAK